MHRLILAAVLALSLVGSLNAAPRDQLVAVFNTQLRAANETTGSTSQAWGHAQIKVFASGRIAWKVLIHNPARETFIAGHIHRASRGVAGPIVLPLFSGPATHARHLDLRGAATNAVLAHALVADPAAYYVNFHTTAFPGGAIRGQLR